MFRAQSLRAQHCLKAVPLQIELTTDYIRTIDRNSHQLVYLTQKKIETTDYRDILEVDVKKEESDIDNFIPESDELKIEYEIKDKLECIDNDGDFSDDNTEQIFVATNPVRDVKVRKGRKKKTKIEEKRVKKKIKKRTSDNDYLPDFDFAKFESSYSVEIIALTKEQQLEEIRARKQSANYQYAAYKCEECGKGFMANDAYNNHKIRHSPSMGAHACEICLVRFKRQSRRQEHQDLHRLKFLCKECSFVSRNRYQAKKHFEWHSGKIHVCKHCGASFTKSSTYLSHVRLQHPAMNVACDVCGETFVGRLGLLQHKSRAHQAGCRCARCGAQFGGAEALARHEPCDPRARPCLVCGETLSTQEELQAHVDERHSTDQFKCVQCDKTFASSKSYEVHHQRVHLNVRWRKSRDKRARRTHTDPPKRKEAMCEVCGKACESNAALVYHQRSHTGERPYKCAQCPKSFTMPQALINHQLVHSDERPHMCSVCPKAFKQKVALQLHSRFMGRGHIAVSTPLSVLEQKLSVHFIDQL
ncbi:zinc finger protein 225-like isoform X2 [Cydia pomonella]|uniref:zinc finger protein 225-like isoform X2 n=1 Tax=Cydia pomonella TaxID=82600 RepID=UPI002ADE31D9|nr:zinc finger protein 225-like isoform X2 [Cydia pomonella]